jgi:hypothetical protein
MTTFKVGDKVRVKNKDAAGLEGTITKQTSSYMFIIRTSNSSSKFFSSFTWRTGETVQFTADRLELVNPGRGVTEGEEIAPEKVIVGDRIRVEYDDDDWGQSITYEGVISEITTDPYDKSLMLRTKGKYTSAIYRTTWSSKRLILVKAAVEPEPVDELLERIKKAEHGQVIRFGSYLAKKKIGWTCLWDVSQGSTFYLETNDDLRTRIGDAKVDFLVPETV